MSATTDSTAECEHCSGERDMYDSVEGSFCSKECYHKHRGGKFLNTLKYDHRYCHGCLSQLKEVERPTDEQLRSIDGMHSAESVVGFQYRTPNADTGEITVRADVIDTVATGVVCGNCGTTDHRDAFMRDFEPTEAAKRLRKRVKETREEGQHSKQFDTSAFVEAWNESHDWTLSLGRALE